MDEEQEDGLRRDVNAQLAKADQSRIAGNEAFRSGDMKKALAQYYSTIFMLKGFDKVRRAYPSVKRRGPIVVPSSADENEDEADGAEGKREGDEEDVAEILTEGVEKGVKASGDLSDAPLTDGGPPTDDNEKVASLNKTMAQTYSNMAACHLRLDNWKKALDFALKSRELDNDDPKATFREATARLKLGEVNRGREMLEQMQARSDDVAVRNMLKQLDVHDRHRSSKADGQFRGMFARAKDKEEATVIGSSAALSSAPS